MSRAFPLIAALFIGYVAPADGQERYFYRNLPYGSEALYNPVSLVLNGSYDIVQMENRSRDSFDLPYGKGRKTALRKAVGFCHRRREARATRRSTLPPRPRNDTETPEKS